MRPPLPSMAAAPPFNGPPMGPPGMGPPYPTLNGPPMGPPGMMPPYPPFSGPPMSAPTTAGSLHSVGPPQGPPVPPPMWMGPSSGPPTSQTLTPFAAPSGPPSAASLSPRTMPNAGAMGAPMSDRFGMPPPAPPSGPPSAESLSPRTMPNAGAMGAPMSDRFGMPPPAPPTQGSMMNGGYRSAPGTGFGPGMMPTVRPAPEQQQQPSEYQNLRQPVVEMDDEDDDDTERLPSGTDKLALYGALDDIQQAEKRDQIEKLKRRRRINVIPALLALFVPWIVFLVTFYTAAFFLHYTSPFLTFVINFGIIVVVVIWAKSSLQNWFSQRKPSNYYPAYLSCTCVVMAVLGWVLGDFNFWTNMQPLYNVDFLAKYTNVNPSQQQLRSGGLVPTRGKRYQDAGVIYFDHDTILDVNQSMSFKMGDLFCVAPIVNKNCKKNCGYDFWAVGMNCCSEDTADFRCGDFDSPSAKSGLRLMLDEQRPHFRMAVLEAEGVHKLMSTHPLFFYWLSDPVKKLTHMKNKGFKMFVLLMIIMFFSNAILAYFGLKGAREKFADS